MKTTLEFTRNVIACLALIGLISSCSTLKNGKLTPTQASFKKQIDDNPVFKNSFTGFHLLDPETSQTIYASNSDKYFTPASNTKILTLYTSMNILGDSMPALRYMQKGDSTIFWGTGDPSLLHNYLPLNREVLDFLRSRNNKVYFSAHNFQTEHFGSGWAWDDYYHYYQPEKSAVPIYGNIVQFDKKEEDLEYLINPLLFTNVLRPNNKLKGTNAKIIRQRFQNIFEYNPVEANNQKFENDLPFKYSDLLFVNLLSEETGKQIEIYPHQNIKIENAQTIYSLPSELLYKKLMQDSDNLIAEQLLLVCSSVLYDTLDTDRIIDHAKVNLFSDLQDELMWHDGSGLSRYNLFTPRSMTTILNKIYQLAPPEFIFETFPAGGQSGTIKNWYAGNEEPYVFAKTGTLSNVHCLSGYIKASSGKVLIFSFMHNNFSGYSKKMKHEMEKVLKNIYQKY